MQHVRDLAVPRQYAMLVVAAISFETKLIDATLLMFDKLLPCTGRTMAQEMATPSLGHRRYRPSARVVLGRLARALFTMTRVIITSIR